MFIRFYILFPPTLSHSLSLIDFMAQIRSDKESEKDSTTYVKAITDISIRTKLNGSYISEVELYISKS